ncbi:MAG: recombinase family protein [Acetobacter sp.]|nr:recombinase family protein [Acetobacter sp.]
MTTQTLKNARIYLRVSTQEQDLARQERLIEEARSAGYYIAGIYKEKASGACPDRPELLRMIADLQQGDVVIAEKIDRLTRLPLPEAEKLIASIREKGARLSVPDVVDLSSIAENTQGVSKIVLEAVQDMLLRLALQMARDDYESRRERQQQGIALAKEKRMYKGRKANTKKHEQIISLRSTGVSIGQIADITGYSRMHVQRVWRKEKEKVKEKINKEAERGQQDIEMFL